MIGDHLGDHPIQTPRDHPSGPNSRTSSDLLGPPSGTTGDHPRRVWGPVPPSLEGDQSHPTPNQEPIERAVSDALDDCRIHLGPRTRAAFVARLAELLEQKETQP